MDAWRASLWITQNLLIRQWVLYKIYSSCSSFPVFFTLKTSKLGLHICLLNNHFACPAIFVPVTATFKLLHFSISHEGTLITKWVHATYKEQWEALCRFISKGGHKFWTWGSIFRFCEQASECGRFTPSLKWPVVWTEKMEAKRTTLWKCRGASRPGLMSRGLAGQGRTALPLPGPESALMGQWPTLGATKVSRAFRAVDRNPGVLCAPALGSPWAQCQSHPVSQMRGRLVCLRAGAGPGAGAASGPCLGQTKGVRPSFRERRFQRQVVTPALESCYDH